MKTSIVVVLTMLEQLTPHGLDTESSEARHARLETLADSIVWAAEYSTCTGDAKTDECVPTIRGSQDEVIASLFTIGKWESWFAQHVHEGRCRTKIGECDWGKAKSVFQILESTVVPHRLWIQLEGVGQDATRKAAGAATLVLGRVWCSTPERRFAGYATGKCDGRFAQAKKRAEDYRSTLARYRAGIQTTNQ